MKTLNIEKKMPSKGDGSTAKALKNLPLKVLEKNLN